MSAAISCVPANVGAIKPSWTASLSQNRQSGESSVQFSSEPLTYCKVVCWNFSGQSIILIQLCKSHIKDIPYIYTLTMQCNLQVFERLQKAIKSNDCTIECRCLLSRESLLIVEGCLMKRLVYRSKRKNTHIWRMFRSVWRTSQSFSTCWSSPGVSL